MIQLKEVEENKLLDNSIIKSIPKTCKCGGKLEFTESLHELVCSNDKCIYVIAKRMYKMTQDMGLKTWDELTCTTLCEQFKFSTPFQALITKQITDNNIEVDINNFTDKVKEIEQFKNKKIHLWKIVEYANIRYVSHIAKELFSNYDSFEKAYKDIDAGQVAFVSEKLGISSNEPSVIAIKIYDEIQKYREELLFAELQLNIIKYKLDPIKLAVSGSIQGFLNKLDFLEYLDIRYNDRISFVLDGNVTEDTQILLADFDTDSKKVRLAKRINDEYISDCVSNGEIDLNNLGKFYSYKDLYAIGEKIIVIKSDELIERLDRVYGHN